jgi:hypothetical protein
VTRALLVAAALAPLSVAAAPPPAVRQALADERCDHVAWTRAGAAWIAECDEPQPIGEVTVGVYLVRDGARELLFRYRRWGGERAHDERRINVTRQTLRFTHEAVASGAHLREALTLDLAKKPAALVEAVDGGIDRCAFGGFGDVHPTMELPESLCRFRAGDAAPRCELPYVECGAAPSVARAPFVGIPLVAEGEDPLACAATVGALRVAAVDERGGRHLYVAADDRTPRPVEKPGAWQDRDHFEIWVAPDRDAEICDGKEAADLCRARAGAQAERLVVAARSDGSFELVGDVRAKRAGGMLALTLGGTRSLGPLAVVYVDADVDGHTHASSTIEVHADQPWRLGRVVPDRRCSLTR